MTKLLGKGIDSSLYVGEQCLCDFLKNGIAAVLYSDIRDSKALHISEGAVSIAAVEADILCL